jgi:DNA ligase (NAD+)
VNSKVNSLEEKYKNLCREIEGHNRLYYQQNDPKISDQDYDKLYKELEKIELEHPSLMGDFSPTQRVGALLGEGEKFEKITHEVPLLSLSNTYNVEDIQVFFSRILYMNSKTKEKLKFPEELVEMSIEPKFDGVSIEIIYENGELVRAVTRGDGLLGDDITNNVRTIKSIPSLLIPPYPQKLVVRGEIFMTFKNFERLNGIRSEKDEKLFMNPRNATAGTLHLKDPNEVDRRNLSCFVYDVLSENVGEKHIDLYALLERVGLPIESIPPLIDLSDFSVQQIQNIINQWNEKREILPYPVDGIVFKINSISQRGILGTNIKDPKWGFAFKFPADRLSTKLIDVEINVGRTGAVTPVAVLTPILLDGSMVSRASLHNFEYIREKDLQINDTVIIEKAAEIIPQVVEVKQHNNDSIKIEIPKFCPSCESTLYKRAFPPKKLKKEKTDQSTPKERFEKVLRCPNPLCNARLEQGLIYFVKRDNMNIDAVGEKLIAQLFSKGLVVTPSQFYQLQLTDLFKLDRMGEKLAVKILKSINKSKKVTFAKFISSLGIAGIGKSNARILAQWFKAPHAILQFKNNNLEDLSQTLNEIDGIGEVLAKDIITHLTNDEVLSEIENLLKYIEIENLESTSTSLFTEKNIAFTGKLSKPRGEFQDLIEKLGGKFSSSVTKKLDFLVCGENSGSKKLKAEKIGSITILSETEFLQMVNNKTIKPKTTNEIPENKIKKTEQTSLF